MGLCRGKDLKDRKQESSERQESDIVGVNMNQEFKTIEEENEVGQNSLIPSQNLQSEPSVNERTVVDNDFSDSDLQSIPE